MHSLLTRLISILQRFKCFGDLDAPDWILAEITVLAKLVSYTLISFFFTTSSLTPLIPAVISPFEVNCRSNTRKSAGSAYRLCQDHETYIRHRI